MRKKLKCKYWKLQNLPQRRFIMLKHARIKFFRRLGDPWHPIMYYAEMYYAEFSDGSTCKATCSYNAFSETFNMYSNVYAVYNLSCFNAVRFTHSSKHKIRIDKSACVKK
jgi:hypothetical protein